MTVINFDLEDGLPPVSFDLNPNDAERFAAFMAECHEALVAAPTPPTQTMPLETLVAEIESDPEMKAALNKARKQDMLEGATVTEITPAQDDEPVAWVEVKDSHNGPYEFHGQELLPPGKHNLYTRPDNSGLRKAAEEVINCFYNSGYDGALEELIINLHKALESK